MKEFLFSKKITLCKPRIKHKKTGLYIRECYQIKKNYKGKRRRKAGPEAEYGVDAEYVKSDECWVDYAKKSILHFESIDARISLRLLE